MTANTPTAVVLAQITDSALFERIATAVLREAKPEIYGGLTHTGVNSDGKTVKAPVDGIAFLPGAYPAHMVLAAHASGARTDLPKKWLQYPLAVTQPAKASRESAQDAGDLLKAKKIFEQERLRTPELRVTIALTTNREPSIDVIRDATSFATANNIELDIWSGSRISHFLDVNPNGQWIRKSSLGIDTQLLSKPLLLSLCRESIRQIQSNWCESLPVSRKLDQSIQQTLGAHSAFVVGESGVGKTVACVKAVVAHIDAGGAAIVVTHEALAQCRTIVQAVDFELRRLCPSLESGAATAALAMSSSSMPLIVLIEDINRSSDPGFLLDRLAGWLKNTAENAEATRSNWFLICPLWPKTLLLASDFTRKRIEDMVTVALPFTDAEATDALRSKAQIDGPEMSPLDAGAIARSLGNDPLLISLYQWQQLREPHAIIDTFVGNQLQRLSSQSTTTLTDFRDALAVLGERLLVYKAMSPTWQLVRDWFSDKPALIAILQVILKDRQVVRLVDNGATERLAFRHDRIEFSVLAHAVTTLVHATKLTDDIAGDPFYAEVIGLSLSKWKGDVSFVDRIQAVNPLALFYALQIFREPRHATHRRVIDCIRSWLGESTTHERANREQRFAALGVLGRTQSSLTIEFASMFRDSTWATVEARFRNGDVAAGIALCDQLDAGVTSTWRDALIEHAKHFYGTEMCQALDQMLRNAKQPEKARSALLRLVGFFADTSLSEAIAASWKLDNCRFEHLDDYLWAAARCCHENCESVLVPMCEVWSSLSDEPAQPGGRSARSAICGEGLQRAFRRGITDEALRFFISHGEREMLKPQITHLLSEVDHPDAVEFVVRWLAELSRSAAASGGFSIYPTILQRSWSERVMSDRSLERLQLLWSSDKSDAHLMKSAFRLWVSTSQPKNLGVLQVAMQNPAICEDALRARLGAADLSAAPELIEKLRAKDGIFWWQHSFRVLNQALIEELGNQLDERRDSANRGWGHSSDDDYFWSDVLIRLPVDVASHLIAEHWDHVRFSRKFVQAALFIATQDTLKLAANAIAECPNASEILKHITMRFGIKTTGHPGVTELRQLEGLVPYLDFLSDLDIHTFWTHCNERGWFEFRKQFLDARLTGRWAELACLEEAQVFSAFHEAAYDNQSWRLDITVKDLIEQGTTVEQILELTTKWLEGEHKIEALEVAATIFGQVARRIDLTRLRSAEEFPVEAAQAITQDTKFCVRLRSLI